MKKDSPKIPLHFQGKEALEHVLEARAKGKDASSELHGVELPGHYYAALDAAKDTTFSVCTLWTLFHFIGMDAIQMKILFSAFLMGWAIWKTGRSGILGRARLEKLHRLIEEEKWEIDHHRNQEKEELRALYQLKGFSGKLLDDAVETLMADENRLLQVMLEEELGLQLESYEHPLKQAYGAFLGVMVPSFILCLVFFFTPLWSAWIVSGGLIGIPSIFMAQLEKNKKMPSFIWNVATFILSLVSTSLLAKLFVSL